jgi:succinate-semialdehyde dehydrogenase/glutarate-semialdehyde dehydrogenase
MRTYLRPEDLKVGDSNAHIHYEPLGLLYVIVPFNFPFWLTFKSCIPNLALGNTVLIRNSDSTPRLGKLLEDLFVSSGFDKGEFQNIYSSPEQTDDIIESKLIQGILLLK